MQKGGVGWEDSTNEKRKPAHFNFLHAVGNDMTQDFPSRSEIPFTLVPREETETDWELSSPQQHWDEGT